MSISAQYIILYLPNICVLGVRYCNWENWSFYDQNIRNTQLRMTIRNVHIEVWLYIFIYSNLLLNLPFQNIHTSMNRNCDNHKQFLKIVRQNNWGNLIKTFGIAWNCKRDWAKCKYHYRQDPRILMWGQKPSLHYKMGSG